jgi:mobilome CxxCx(11)CxxC protein
MSTSSLQDQERRRRESLVRAYQTYYLFRTRRREKLGLKLITFLGIAVPLISATLVQILYAGVKLPGWLITGSALIGLVLTVLSVWALVDKWDEKAQMTRPVVEEFRKLVTDLDLLRVTSSGTYDEEKLFQLEQQSYGGRHPDDDFDVSERVKRRALKRAEEKYPPIDAKG